MTSRTLFCSTPASARISTASAPYANNKIIGNDGDNKIVGDVGNDTLTGNAGNDTLSATSSASAGLDVMIGGAGDDVYEIDRIN